ncbi:MAG TPA: SDR family oxidoreductase [Candidatus Dormibacteraeota bacterium]|nr:SDR family oxidoreductase [Candidatus Dormibacteraeota bacterium]
MGLFNGKVAFITGAGRGQGRSHAIRIAAEGADLALVDMGSAGKVEYPPYKTATSADLQETKRLCEAKGAHVCTFEVDVRNHDGLKAAADDTAQALGGIDYVIANAGITDGFYPTWELPVENWTTMIDINLTGVFYTVKATVPHVRKRGPGGSLILVSSNIAGYKASGYLSHYVAAKLGVRGLAMALAKELGPDGIRCNSLHPAAIYTAMTDHMVEFSGIPIEQLLQQFRDNQLLAVNVEPRDATAAVVWLLSDEARYVTGLEFNIDAGDSRK